MLQFFCEKEKRKKPDEMQHNPGIIRRKAETGNSSKQITKTLDFVNQKKAPSATFELKEELRLPVILYYVEDFNIREIAQILDLTEGAVQKRLARAREKLRADLRGREAFV